MFAQSNDDFSNRLTLAGPAPLAVSNLGRATSETGEPRHAGASAGRSLWYSWTAPFTGAVNLSTYYTGTGAPTLRAVGVYTGNSLATLVEVASSNNQAQNLYLLATYTSPLQAGGASVNLSVTAGTVYQIAVDAVSAPTPVADDGTVVLAINAPPTILSAASVTGTTGASFAYAIAASAGPTAFGATSLPAGLSVNPASGQITGVPAAAGTYVFNVSATGPGGTGTGTVTLRVGDPPANGGNGGTGTPAAPTITSAASARGFVGAAFSFTVMGSPTPTGFTAGSLPPGLSLNASTGVISGTPTTAGTFAVPVSATNAGGTGAATLTVAVYGLPPAPVITSALAVTGTVGSGTSYSITTNLDGQGSGIAPTAWTATGLPPGLTLTVASNYLNGTPTTAGVYPVVITAANPGGTRQAVVTMTVQPGGSSTNPNALAAPVLGNSAAAWTVVGTAFVYTLTATNAPTGFTADGLPPGLTINATTGAISGTPTATGTYSVPVTATNAYGTSTGTLVLTVYASSAALAAANGAALPIITSPASAAGYVGTSFSYTATAAYQGTSFFSGNWTFAATGLPPGMTLSASSSVDGTAAISGTPTAAGTYPATISATRPAYTSTYVSHPAVTGTATVTFVVLPAGSAPAVLPMITSAAGTTAAMGSSFSYSTVAQGNPTGYTASGLPPGVTINATSGLLSGTPTAGGTFPVTITAANSVGSVSATVRVLVAAPPPFVTSAAAAEATVGTAFTYTLAALNSPTGYAANGTLPPGLTFNAATATLSGTPTAAGVYRVPLSATNAGGTASVTLTVSVAAAPPAPILTSGVYASATVGAAFTYQITAAGPVTTYTAGSLPPGLTFNAAAGSVGGTPTQAGVYTVPITAANASGTAGATVTIRVSLPPLPVFGSYAVAYGTVGQAFDHTVTATNGPTGYSFSTLPPGIAPHATTPGRIVGTPTTAGTYPVTVTTANAGGSQSATLTIIVKKPAVVAPPVFYSSLGAAAVAGTPFGYAAEADGTPTSFALDSVPPGLTFNPATGTLSGTPTAAGTYTLGLSATNAGGTGRAAVSLVVYPGQGPAAPQITSPAQVYLFDNDPFFYQVTASNAPVGYAASGLPAGLTIHPATGVISGKLSVNSYTSYSATISATNALGTSSATLVFSTQPNPAPFHLTSPAAAAGVVNQAFSTTLTLPFGSGYTFAATGLPPGLSLNGSTGVIAGTPTTAGTYTATITVGGTPIQMVFVIGAGAAPAVPVIVGPIGTGNYPGIPVTYQIAASNSPTSFAASGLPDGLLLDPATGVIFGTPTGTGLTTATVTATNAAGSSNAFVTFDIASSTSVGLIACPLTQDGFVGMPFSTTLKYYGTLNSSLPPGLAETIFSISPRFLNTISGVPTTAGATVVSLTASGSYGGAFLNFVIGPSPSGLPVFTSNASASGTASTTLSYNLAATNNPTAYAATNLPAGLTLTAAGLLSGVPTTPGTFAVPVTATNAAGTSGATLTVVIADPGPPEAIGDPLEYSLAQGSSLSFSMGFQGYITSYGATGLPPGFTQSGSVIQGTATTAGTYQATLSATNSSGTTSKQVLFLVTASGPPPTFPSLPAESVGYTGVLFSAQTDSTYGVTYAASGLPPGLAISSSGEVVGTPTTPGTYNVTLSATNAAGTSTVPWTVIIRDASALRPVFTSGTAEINATAGTTIFWTFRASSYDGARYVAPTYSIYSNVTFSVTNLPAGINANPSTDELDLIGTTTPGTYPLTITATAVGGVTSSIQVLLVVNPVAMVITSSAGAVANLNNAFSYQIVSSATATAYTCGTLPAGLAFDAAKGRITGTPTAAGTYTVALGAFSPYGAGTASLTLRVEAAPFGNLPLITSAAAISSQDFPPDTSSLSGFLGPAVNYTLTGYNTPTSWTMGSVPTGMVFNPATGVLSGTPADVGTYRLPVTATNAAGTFAATLTLVANSPRAAVQPALAYGGVVGRSFAASANVYFPALLRPYANGTDYPLAADPVLYTATGLPPGLSINGYTGQITGPPTQAGTYQTTVSAANRGGSGSAVTTFTITGSLPAAASPPVFSSSIRAEAVGFPGVPMTYTLSATGSVTGYTVQTLPAGLVLNPVTGVISGTPLVTGTTTTVVSATNSAGTAQATLTLTVEAAPAAPAITSASVASMNIGSTFSYSLTTSNFSGLPTPTSYAATGLPAGLGIDPLTGSIGGAPTGPAGTYLVTVTAVVGTSATNATLTFVVNAPLSPALASSAAGALALLDNPFSYTIRSASLVPLAGTLPAGLVYNASDGSISGYPQGAGTNVLTLQSPAGDTAALTVQIVTPDLSLPRLTAQPVGGTVMEGSGFTLSAGAVGAPAPACQWYRNGSAVPGATGGTLTIGATTPADTGSYVCVATNAAGSVASAPVSLLVQTTYGLWQADHFTAQEINAGLANEQSSFSGDGVPNLLKYALGLDPRVPANGALTGVALSPGTGALRIAFVRDAGHADLDYIVETLPDLNAGPWTTIAEGDAGAAVAPVNGGAASARETVFGGGSLRQVTVEAVPPAGGSRQFLRLRVVRH